VLKTYTGAVVQQYVDARFDFLKAAQNPDGGWGYFPGKRSWLEPTVFAMLALHEDALAGGAFTPAWDLMRSWQLPSGGWRPCAAVADAHWSTALCVTLHCVRGVYDAPFQKGVAWLLETAGAERRWAMRFANLVRPLVVEFDPSLSGWPWLPGASSWVEPTVHAVMALKRAQLQYDDGKLSRRVALGEQMILERQCSDGGWNHGNRKVLGKNVASYPESTALALLGLKGNRAWDFSSALNLAGRCLAETQSELARAWLRVSLRSYGMAIADPGDAQPTDDILLAAIETLAYTGVLE